jgi:hypothetical protein
MICTLPNGIFEGGLWPLFWMTVAICVTVYALKRRKTDG